MSNWKASVLVFGSGFCALLYQTVWMRQLRLVFGSSTGANAAVLAIFMAGLGAGSVVLGRRADRSDQPLTLYGRLEFGISLFTAFTPVLIALAASLYFASGGSSSLGNFGATIVRVVLTTVVLGVPTFLMGGTLPAIARSVQIESDVRRRSLALLYGANTLGAVLGAFISTFYLLEHFGNRITLWIGCGVNLVVAFAAILLGALVTPPAIDPAEGDSPDRAEVPRHRNFILVSAGIVGLAFFVMESVWYRLLTPLLGGTTYTFGIILVLALAGIGLGGLTFSLLGRSVRSTMGGFAVSCAVEAALLAFPYALGDRIAVFAILVRPLASIGFGGSILGWCLVAFVVVIPPAVVAGFQFPLLISLLGTGRRGIGSDIGQAYAWNTGGAIVGALAGGFLLFPFVGALRTWIAMVLLLVVTSFLAWLISPVRQERRDRLPLALIVIAILLAFASVGPTAAWRHSGIGAGRSILTPGATLTPNGIADWIAFQRRVLAWEQDGIESSVAMAQDQGLAFVINGKGDGHSRFDAGTQVMLGMLGATIHGNVRNSLVVGLGTGTTAGWLAAIPSMKRVDVVELEPAVVRVAADCAPVNENAMRNPKLKIRFGDAREVLLTSRQQYDLIASEPSNPYRAGIASLYTPEFYRAVSKRLLPGGIFLQWLQAYEVNASTVRTIYATFQSVFPHVQTWETEANDIVLIGSAQPVTIDVPRVRHTMQQEPFKSAFLHAWRVDSLEGMVAHYLGGDLMAETLGRGARISTDDRTVVEFAFARSLGVTNVSEDHFRAVGKYLKDDMPAVGGGSLDPVRVANGRMATRLAMDAPRFPDPTFTPEMTARSDTHESYKNGDFGQVIGAWTSQHMAPDDPSEILNYADSAAEVGNASAIDYAEKLRLIEPIDADLVLARYYWRKHDLFAASSALEKAFLAARTDPWSLRLVLSRGLDLAASVSREDTSVAKRMYAALSKPFAVRFLDQQRLHTLVLIGSSLSSRTECSPFLLSALQSFEPHFPWNGQFLALRSQCYEQLTPAAAGQARKDLSAFVRGSPTSLADALTPRAAQ